jgi:chaperonin GroEL
MEEVGQDGVITVEEGKSLGLEKEVVQGMQFDQGYVSPYFVSDPQRMESIVENPLILITDKKISSMKDILKVIEGASASGKKDFVIIADDVEGEALTSLVLNKMRGIINVLAIKAPGFGDRKKAMLQDLAAVTGAQLVTEELGLQLDQVGMEVLGSAKKVVTTKDKTTIIDGAGDAQQIADRVGQIKAQIANTSSDYDREKLVERVAKLAGGVAVIRVGAATEIEMKNRKYKIEDALNATRAAVEEGILPGGGTSLVKLAKKLESIDTTDEDERAGIDIVRNAILYPVTQIADNAGHKGDRVVEEVKSSDDFNHGFNAATGDFVDLVAQGIIDPTKVIRVALQNAVSAAAMFLTTDAVIIDLPEDKPDAGAPAGGGGMGGM